MATNFDQCSPDLESLQAQALVQGDIVVLSAVTQNTELLQQLFQRMQDASGSLESEDAFDEFDNLDFGNADDNAIEAVDENIRLRAENTRLNSRINALEQEIESLTDNNHDLASKVVYGATASAAPTAPAAAAPAAAPVAPESLSWEERKRQIIEQMENDEFDAESFLSTLDVENPSESCKSDTQQAIDYVNDLVDELDRLRQSEKQSRFHNEKEFLVEQEMQQQVDRYVDEISELKESLRQLQESSALIPTEPVTESVDPIAEILDHDQIIQQERERLQQIQEDCEQKLRDIEIRSSLERAKLSRELSIQVQKNRELETQVNALQRQAGMKEDATVGTRWMAKLGLTGDRKD
ncbi:MAG: hypothetical protein KDB00_18050 [Planctomycetales bacterium]|nr:hypothetical protein [Planctomycetales bacterium]